MPMTLRERFLEIMNFNPAVEGIKWEFGYWGETIERWYAQGLPSHHPPQLPVAELNPTTDLYTRAWNSIREGLPRGIGVMAGGLYWPTQGFPEDFDVRDCLGLDQTQQLVRVNLLFQPVYPVRIWEEDEDHLVYQDLDGVRRRFLKASATIPAGEAWPVTDWASWRAIKAERLNLSNLSSRFPSDWPDLVKEYRNREYPLALGGYPCGFFGTPAHLMGYENLFIGYHHNPDLIHDIVATFTDLWIAVYEEVLSEVEVDHVQIWEDVSFGGGSMVSPSIIREFMLPCYQRFTGFLKGRGITNIFVDTDGYCFDIIPLLLEGGITGLYPFETSCGMDIVRVRQQFPRLQMMGGVPKSEIALGRERIEQILQPVQEILPMGGFIPFGDHFIPPEVGWPEFRTYRERLNQMIDNSSAHFKGNSHR